MLGPTHREQEESHKLHELQVDLVKQGANYVTV